MKHKKNGKRYNDDFRKMVVVLYMLSSMKRVTLDYAER